MFYLKNYLLTLLIVVKLSSTTWASLDEQDVEIKIHNVGQGNCVTLKVQEEGKKEPSFMIIDAGTSSYVNELTYNLHQSPLAPTTEISDPLASTIKKDKFSLVIEENKETATKIKKGENEFFKNMRTYFGEEDEDESVHIKTLIITHPDVDHYSWISKIFSRKKDQIDYLIFGGLPSCYDESGKKKFKKFIQYRIDNDSKIFFPAIQYDPITSLDEVLEKEKKRSYAPHSYTPVKGKWPADTIGKLKEAVNFGDQIEVSFLAINPAHLTDSNRNVRLVLDTADNSDSLVLKVSCGQSSILLTGDATINTYTRIENNYYDNPEFLQANVYLASHHGSSTHEANDVRWLNLFKPQYVLISSGHKHGHPAAESYENFKNLERLKLTDRHKVLVGKSKDKNVGTLHTTSNAIFSTLCSGTLTVKLHQNKEIELYTEQEKKINIYDRKTLPNEASEEDVEEVSIDEQEEGNVIFTSTKKPKSSSKDLAKMSSLIPQRLEFDSSEEDEFNPDDIQIDISPPQKKKKVVNKKHSSSSSEIEGKPRKILKSDELSENDDEAPVKEKKKTTKRKNLIDSPESDEDPNEKSKNPKKKFKKDSDIS